MRRGPSSLATRAAPAAAFALLVGTAGAALWVGPEAAWTDPLSDAVEYAVAARRLAEHGTYDVVVGGEAHAPRYPPGFSALFLAPLYRLGATRPGDGIVAVFASALVVVACCWRLCRRVLPGVAGVAAAYLTVALLVHATPFRIVTAQIMSDTPTLALFFCGLVLFRRVVARPSTPAFGLAGLLTGVALLVRPTSVALCLPFAALVAARPAASRASDAAALFAPIALAGAGLLAYQDRTFGDPLFTGYHYWLAPEQYRLSTAHVAANLARVPHPFLPVDGPVTAAHRLVAPVGLAIVVVLGIDCHRRDPALFRRCAPVVAWALLAALPIALVHLFYPFPMARFGLVLHATVLLLFAIWLCALLADLHAGLPIAVAVASLVGILDARLPAPAPNGAQPLDVVRAADARLPRDAVFVSDLNGVYVHETMIDGTDRTHLAATAAAPFVGWQDVGLPGAAPARVLGRPALRATARIDAALAAGRRVFVHVPARPSPAPAWRRLRARYALAAVWRGGAGGPSIAEVVATRD